MTTKTDLRTLMEGGGELTTLNKRMMEAVRSEQDSGDDSAGYLSIATQTGKDNPNYFRSISCASGRSSALCAGVINFLGNNPKLIPFFEIAVELAKAKIQPEQPIN
jgi:hypothetical protein